MAWLRVCDTAESHWKVLALEHLCKGDLIIRDAVFGGLTAMAAWSAEQYTDAFVPATMARRRWGADMDRMIRLARAANLLHKKTTHKALGPGWVLVTDDGLWNILSKEEVEKNRNAKKRRPAAALARQIKARDGDECRYCGRAVAESDHDQKSALKREFDHIDPSGPTNLANVVVACKECNGRKGTRTLDEILAFDQPMVLLPPPLQRGEELFFHPDTRAELARFNLLPRPTADPATTRPVDDLRAQQEIDVLADTAAVDRDEIADPIADPRYAEPGSPGTGRAGPGRGGTGREGTAQVGPGQAGTGGRTRSRGGKRHRRAGGNPNAA